jgi:hypothetical protein
MSELPQTNIDQKDIEPTPDPGTRLLEALYSQAPTTDSRRTPRLEISGSNRSINRPALVERDVVDYERGLETREALTHIIAMGGTLIGVSRAFNMPLKAGTRVQDGGEIRVRFSVLPFGVNAGLGVARMLAEVNLDTLKKPRPEGYVQEWEDIQLGRGMIADKTGIVDPAVSGEHALLKVNADGKFEVKDTSSLNGTTVIDDGFVYSSELKEPLVGFVRSLQAGVRMWSPDAIPGLDDTVELVSERPDPTLLGQGVVSYVNSGSVTGVEKQQTKQDILDRLTDGLSDDDKAHLQGYANSQARVREAQRASDGQGSRDAQEAAGWHFKKLSPNASKIASQYADIANK